MSRPPPPPRPAAWNEQRPDGLHGRGASDNIGNRFEPLWLAGDDDPDRLPDDERTPGPGPATLFFTDRTRSILTHNDSPDVGFDTSFNPYRGCEHGCIYCYARPGHEFLGWSAGVDFESRILVKTEAQRLLREELAAPSWRPRVIAASGVTDCYQPIERRLKLYTRLYLAVLTELRNPVSVITKNALVTRDSDLLARCARARDQTRPRSPSRSPPSIPSCAGGSRPRTSAPCGPPGGGARPRPGGHPRRGQSRAHHPRAHRPGDPRAHRRRRRGRRTLGRLRAPAPALECRAAVRCRWLEEHQKRLAVGGRVLSRDRAEHPRRRAQPVALPRPHAPARAHAPGASRRSPRSWRRRHGLADGPPTAFSTSAFRPPLGRQLSIF